MEKGTEKNVMQDEKTALHDKEESNTQIGANNQSVKSIKPAESSLRTLSGDKETDRLQRKSEGADQRGSSRSNQLAQDLMVDLHDDLTKMELDKPHPKSTSQPDSSTKKPRQIDLAPTPAPNQPNASPDIKPLKPGYKSSMKLFCSKIYYKLCNSVAAGAKNLKITDKEDRIFILGREYSVREGETASDANTRLDEDLALVGGFTYRSFPNPIPGTSLFTDAGWGCMIRVGQMVLFNALVRGQVERGEEFLEDRLNCVLLSFNDALAEDAAPYSIQNIVPIAYEHFKVEKGSWFRSTTAMMSLDLLNKKYTPTVTGNLEMLTLIDSTVSLDKIYQRVFRRPADSLSSDQIVTGLTEGKWPCQLLLSLATQVGVFSPQTEFKDFFAFLMSNPYSIGALGGEGNRAFYIIGLNKKTNTYFYLDPHAVQQSVSLTNHTIGSYFSRPIYSMQYESMNPSVTFSFLIQDNVQFAQFYQALKEECERPGNSDAVFLSVMEKEPTMNADDVIIML